MKKLKVGIVITKNTPEYLRVSESFRKAVENIGDKTIFVPYLGDLSSLHEADVIFQSAYPVLGNCFDCLGLRTNTVNVIPDNWWRIKVYKFAEEKGIRSLFIDRGAIGKNYYQCGFDCIKNNGEYYNQDISNDRLDKLGIVLSPYIKSASNRALLFGQVRFGIGTQGIDVYDWYNFVQSKIKCVIRRHFNDKVRHHTDSQITNIEHDILESALTISYNSNAAIQSMILGVPTICMNPLSMLYPEAFSSKISIFELDNRYKILARIMYTQWKEDEFEEMWKHLREGHINGHTIST